MEEKLKVFMESRQIPSEIIVLLEKEKMDMTTIPLMEDKELAEYIPHFGDRLALKNFCKTQCTHKRESLLEEIRQKYGAKKNEESEKKSKKFKKDKERIVDFGWHHKYKNGFTQVRTKQGGGTRSVKMLESAKKADILSRAQEMYFPNGFSSRFGHISKYKVDLWDFKCNPIEEDLSVEQIYQITGLNRLRFYLSTEEKNLPETIVRESLASREDNSFKYNEEASYSPDFDTKSDDKDKELQELCTGVIPLDSSKENIVYDLEEYLAFPSETNVNPTHELSPLNHDPFHIILHRGQVFRELLEIFKNLPLECGIEVEMILPNGKRESGLDLGGVYRDALSEFWSSFYNQSTLGTTYKIPFIRHDMKEDDWIAVANILKKGFMDVQYFPIKIGPAFLQYCVFGKCDGNLLDTFSKYVSPNDWKTLSNALEDFDSVESDELLEVLDTLECKWNPSKENIKNLVLDIAHKELIQKPMFVIDCWKSVLKGLLNLNELQIIYESKKASPKNILGIFTFAEDNSVCAYLKKFVRESNEEVLQNLLRFATGSDMITENIKVDFNSSTGLQRTPIGHTCSTTLELSRQYDNYVDFRCEMNDVLKSNIWIMDII